MVIRVASIHTLISGYGNLYSDLFIEYLPYPVIHFMRLPCNSPEIIPLERSFLARMLDSLHVYLRIPLFHRPYAQAYLALVVSVPD